MFYLEEKNWSQKDSDGEVKILHLQPYQYIWGFKIEKIQSILFHIYRPWAIKVHEMIMGLPENYPF